MNNVNPKKKESILKTLAIFGFIAIIIVIAWVSVKLVNTLPGAFGSLASLAEGVNEYQQSIIDTEPDVPFVVTSESTLINSGEAVDIDWETPQGRGTFTFAYSCSEGIAVEIQSVDGLQSIECNTNYNVGNVTGMTIEVDSEKNRYADLSYTVSFLRSGDQNPSASGSATLTVVNTDISNLAVGNTDEAEESPEQSIVAETEEEPTGETLGETDSTEETPVTTPSTPTYEQEFVYAIPTSDPNGRTDLSTRFIAVGRIIGNTFFATELAEGDAGAIQFEVKNYGNKTSEDWTFSVTLPSGGVYESPTQDPLKPNERAVLTIGFPETNLDSFTFEVDVDVRPDRNTANNNFTQVVSFE